MFAQLQGVRIAAIHTAVPQQEIRIEDELEYYGGSLKKAERAKSMIGTDRRRVAYPGQTASDLCHAAASELFAVHPEEKQSIEALIFVTQSPDFDQPATACTLQHRLGLPQSCATFDVNQGCAGYVYGLWLAGTMVASGSCSSVLLLVGDAPYRPRDPRNRIMAPIFGDAGSATLITRDADAAPLFFSIGTDGAGFSHIIQPGGRARVPFSDKFENNNAFFKDIQGADGYPWRLCDTYMDGPAVFNFTLRVIPEHIRDFLMRSGADIAKIDYFVLHQANKQIISEIARKAGLPQEKTPSATFSRYGNLSSASIPAALCDLFGQDGSIGQRKIMLCGYGIGLTWASCLWEPTNCACTSVLSVPAPDSDSTLPEAQIRYWCRYIQGERDATC